jgi:hypothetical protein
VSGYVIAQGQSDRERPLLSGSGGLGAQVFREKILKVVEYVIYDQLVSPLVEMATEIDIKRFGIISKQVSLIPEVCCH